MKSLMNISVVREVRVDRVKCRSIVSDYLNGNTKTCKDQIEVVSK